MTMLDDRPMTGAMPAPPPLRDRGVLAPWRLAARLARRETRRRPGRTMLAALLIAIPVAAMTLGSVLVRTEHATSAWPAPFELRWPGADVMVSTDEATLPDVLERAGALPGSRVLSYLEVGTELTAADARFDRRYVSFTDMPLDDPMLAGSLDIIDGRTPGDGEMLLSPDVAGHFDVGVGDELVLERPAGTWTVSGIGRSRLYRSNSLAVVAGFDRDRIAPDQRYLTTLIDVPDDVIPDALRQYAARIGGQTRFDPPYEESSTSTLAWGWVGGVLALVAVGIIVAAAFATSARRQLVTVGQLASNGATQSVIRRSLVLQGTWTALVGAAAGTGAALLALPLLRGVVESWVLDRYLVGYRIAASDLIAIVATAILAGTIAAAVPARSLSKVPVMAALSGRRPLGRPPRWLVSTGVALTLGGLGLLAVAGAAVRNANASGGGGNDLFALAIIVATVAVVFGMVCATPLVVERAGRLAPHVGLAPRLALRSMGRARTRSAAVVAAIAVTVGGAVAAGMVADAAIIDSYAAIAYLPDDAVVLQSTDQYAQYEGDEVIDPGPPEARALDPAEQAVVDEAFPGADVSPLLISAFDPPPFRWSDSTEIWPTGEGVLIATPELVELVGLSARDRATLEREGSLHLDPDSPASSSDEQIATIRYPIGDEVVTLEPPKVQDPPTTSYASYSTVLTAEHAESLGFSIVQRGVIVRAGEPLTDEQIDAVNHAFNGGINLFDAFVEPGDPPRPGTDGTESTVVSFWSVSYEGRGADIDRSRELWIARAVIVGLAVLLTLAVVAIGLSLAAAEGRGERDTLMVVGATPATMRRQAAANAAVLALAGVVLGVPLGFAPTSVLWQAINVEGWMPFPWVVVAILVAGVPLLAAGTAWLGSGIAQRVRPVTLARRD